MYVVVTARLYISFKLTFRIAGSGNPVTAKFSCGTPVHVIPYKGVASLHASDVGEPEAIIFKNSAKIPEHVSLKKVGSDDWVRFEPTKGEKQPDGSLLVYAKKAPSAYPWPNDRMATDVMRADKQFGIEYWKSFIS